MEFFKNSPKMKALTFSFDDGVTQDIRMVELLDKYGLKATFNLNSEKLGLPRIMIQASGRRISHHKIAPKDVKELYKDHEVAVHTLNHPNLTTLDDAEVIRQVEEDRKNLEALVGYDVVGMAYPCGGVNNDARVAAILRDHTKIRYARTLACIDSFDMRENLYQFDSNARILQFDRLMELGKQFIEMKPEKKQLFYIWGHTYEMDYDSKNWMQFEAFLEMISGHDDIFYGTNTQVIL